MATQIAACVKGEEYAVMEGLWYYDCLLSPKSSPASSPHHCLNASPGISNTSSVEKRKRSEKQGIEIKEEKDSTEGMFYLLDEDEDGRVSVSEIMNLLQRLGMDMPMSEIECLVNGISGNGVGHLSLDGFRDLYGILFSEKDGEVDEDGLVKEAFSVFDANGDGLISAQDLTGLLKRLGYDNRLLDDELNSLNLIEKADRNGDGFIDFHEFKHFIMDPHPLRTVSSSAAPPLSAC